jgi:hypothetical protein
MMVKTLGKFLSILVVVGLLAGGLFLIFNNTTSQMSSNGSGAGLEGAPSSSTNSQATTTDSTSQSTQAQFQGNRGHDEESGSASQALGILVNIAKIAGITFIVAMIQKTIARFSRKPVLKQSSSIS